MTPVTLPLAQLAVSMEPEASASLQLAATTHLIDQASDVLAAANSGVIATTAGAVPELTQAIAALEALESLDHRRKQTVVQHPTFRYWHQATRRTSDGADPARFVDFIGRLPELVWSEIAEDRPWEGTWWLRADELGGLRCPSRRRYVELGPKYGDTPVAARVAVDHVVLQCLDGLIVRIPFEDLRETPDSPPSIEEHGYEVKIATTVGDGLIQVFSRDPWIRLRITGTNQRNDGSEFFGSAADLYPESFDVSGVEGALGLLAHNWPDEFADLPLFTQVLVPIVAPQSLHRAFTVSSRQGAVYVCSASPADTVEMLIHENAHIKLRQVQLLDTLLVDPLDETIRVSVPWRPDPRPIPGVLEGLYVFAHVAEYRQRAVSAGSGASTGVGDLIRNLRDAQRLVLEHGKFTAVGEEFLGSMQVWLDRLEIGGQAQ